MNEERQTGDRPHGLIVPLAIGVFVIGGAATLFRPAYNVGNPSNTPTVASRVSNQEVSAGFATTIDRTNSDDVSLASGRSVDTMKATLPSNEVQQLYDRGQALVASGDFAGARLLFSRAAETGHAAAIFALASTYDPNVLFARGARGLVGEPEQARALYAKALQAGVQDAKERLAALGG